MSTPTFRIVATTLTDLHKEPSFVSEMLTQVTNGVELELLHIDGEWCRVRMHDGYEGWAHGPYLGEPSPSHEATHLVIDRSVGLHVSPSEKTATRLPIGCAVRVCEQKDEWARVELVGNLVPSGWTQISGLRPIASLPLPTEKARAQILADARRLTGAYYLWGGSTAWGLDCSGLTQLCHRLSGYAIPRDAKLQFPAGRPVEPPFQTGDLLYFHSETNRERITHVGISTGVGWNMIHSSRGRNGVYEEDLDSPTSRRRRAHFAGARSFL